MVAAARGLQVSSIQTTKIPIFLAPAFAPTTSIGGASSPRSFATTPRAGYHKKSGALNKQRGVSAIRRTGPRVTKGLWAYPLPEPVIRTRQPRADEYQGTQDHGLWGFFNDARAPMIAPEKENEHGRGWTYQELTNKGFHDLHKLYWKCILEKNQVLTRYKEMDRVRAGYGEPESERRVIDIQTTMKNIREVLADRQLEYDEAWAVLEQKAVTEIFAEQIAAEEAAEAGDHFEWDDSVPALQNSNSTLSRPPPDSSSMRNVNEPASHSPMSGKLA